MRQIFRPFYFAFWTSFVLALPACGGGGGSTAGSAFYAPFHISIQQAALYHRLLEQHAVTLSLSDTRADCPGGTAVCADAVVAGGGAAGDVYTITAAMTITQALKVFSQNGTLFLARRCESETDGHCFEGGAQKPRVFNLPDNIYNVEDKFRFTRGLIRDAHQFGGWHANAKDRHVEYRRALFSGAFLDGGFRRFPRASLFYGKTQINFGGVYFQTAAGYVKSSYYKEGAVYGAAVGWQKNNFTAKAEKPPGGDSPPRLMLFYKNEFY